MSSISSRRNKDFETPRSDVENKSPIKFYCEKDINGESLRVSPVDHIRKIPAPLMNDRSGNVVIYPSPIARSKSSKRTSSDSSFYPDNTTTTPGSASSLLEFMDNVIIHEDNTNNNISRTPSPIAIRMRNLDDLATTAADDSNNDLQQSGSDIIEESLYSGRGSVTRNDDGEETEQERRAREDAESEALARQLMAEEAMSTYATSMTFLRQNSEAFSSEDLAALEAAMAEEDPEVAADGASGDEDNDHDDDVQDSRELSYDTLLRLGERIGDVKTERWTMRAKEEIAKLPTIIYELSEICFQGVKNDSTDKCLVCQCDYEDADTLRKLPCNHVFHTDCVDQWLLTKDFCPYCRQCIMETETSNN